jgi:hypothetical protein
MSAGIWPLVVVAAAAGVVFEMADLAGVADTADVAEELPAAHACGAKTNVSTVMAIQAPSFCVVLMEHPPV